MKVYAKKRECSVQGAVYLVMPELWLRKEANFEQQYI